MSNEIKRSGSLKDQDMTVQASRFQFKFTGEYCEPTSARAWVNLIVSTVPYVEGFIRHSNKIKDILDIIRQTECTVEFEIMGVDADKLGRIKYYYCPPGSRELHPRALKSMGLVMLPYQDGRLPTFVPRLRTLVPPTGYRAKGSAYVMFEEKKKHE